MVKKVSKRCQAVVLSYFNFKQMFGLNGLNELTDAAGQWQGFDADGNATSVPGPDSGPSWVMTYDNENRLVNAKASPGTAYRHHLFYYDGLVRLRKRSWRVGIRVRAVKRLLV